MGCLKKIISIIVFIIMVYLFFALGGYTFLKNKYDEYTCPQRAVFIEEEKDFGDLANISADYSLSRSLNFFGFRKLNALYIPKKQHITIYDLNSNDFIVQEDFETSSLKQKLNDFSGKIFNSPLISLQNVNITETGKIKAGNVEVPYADFEADIKTIPFLKVTGTIALYKTKNRQSLRDKIKKSDGITSKLLVSCKFLSQYDSFPVKKFISQIGL